MVIVFFGGSFWNEGSGHCGKKFSAAMCIGEIYSNFFGNDVFKHSPLHEHPKKAFTIVSVCFKHLALDL